MTLTSDETHDAHATSWVAGTDDHPDFPVQNLPLGILIPPGETRPRGCVAIGDFALDVAAVAHLLTGAAADAARLAGGTALNTLFSDGNAAAEALRAGLFALLQDRAQQSAVQPSLHRIDDCTPQLPFVIGDYTDFYTGIAHAENVGKLFRPDNPLLPNYKYVPIGYHGRSSSIRVSGEPVKRPNGQRKLPDVATPTVGPTQRFDYELEMAIWVGEGNDLGRPIAIGDAHRHVAGYSILNDWSARDFQAWEYQPLGPFLAKNFHSTVSPWVVTSSALEPFRVAQPPRATGDPAPLPYLSDEADQAAGAFAITMEVHLSTAAMREAGAAPMRLSRGPMTAMYWTVAQLLAHHSVNGCNLRPGDLLGTGTLSSTSPDTLGSLLELTKGGSNPITLSNGETRTFLLDGDEVIMTAFAEAPGRRRIGFGACRARVTD